MPITSAGILMGGSWTLLSCSPGQPYVLLPIEHPPKVYIYVPPPHLPVEAFMECVVIMQPNVPSKMFSVNNVIYRHDHHQAHTTGRRCNHSTYSKKYPHGIRRQ